MSDLDLSTPIYIDSSLRHEMRGELVAKEFFEAGFRTIYLTTGYQKAAFGNMPWIADIVEKSPPWGPVMADL